MENKVRYVFLKRIALRLFGKYTDMFSATFIGLKNAILKSGMDIIFRTYVSLMFFTAFFSLILSFIVLYALFYFNVVPFAYVVFIPLCLSVSSFIIFYAYPFFVASSRRRNMEANLPFAINHMSAVATSGVPPYMIFKLLSKFGEYGEVSKESGKIVRNMEVFGQDITTSLKEVSARSPSKLFSDLLDGICSIIETGGNLQTYLAQQAEAALFEYRMKREKYMEILSTYADFYTAVLIAAPMFLVAILAIMNMIGGELFGMSIDQAMNIGIFVLMPVLNIGFILFVHMTQPEI